MSDLSAQKIYRAAGEIHGRIQRRRTTGPPDLPQHAWRRCQRLRELLHVAASRGWHAAAEHGRNQLRQALTELRWRLETVGAELPSGPAVVTTVGDVYHDLVALTQEFSNVQFDLTAKTIALATSPIELEGVYLGAFTVQLEWEQLGGVTPHYRVIALDESCAAADSSVTHPHVRDEGLCEGEAYSSIRSALAEGRLLDFFTIVAQTLATYNAQSAYVTLDRWQGVACSDCGYTACDDDRTCCEQCDNDVCHDCSAGCQACGQTLCSECSCRCTACSNTHCSSCLQRCAACGEDYCKGCLDERLCDECRRRAADEDDEDKETVPAEAQAGAAAAPAASAAVLAVCVG